MARRFPSELNEVRRRREGSLSVHGIGVNIGSSVGITTAEASTGDCIFKPCLQSLPLEIRSGFRAWQEGVGQPVRLPACLPACLPVPAGSSSSSRSAPCIDTVTSLAASPESSHCTRPHCGRCTRPHRWHSGGAAEGGLRRASTTGDCNWGV